MKHILFIFGVLAFLAAPGSAYSDLIINEIRIDQPGADDDEYFELFATTDVDLSTFTYVVIGDSPGAGAGGFVEEATALTGTLTAGEFFLVAEGTFSLADPSLVDLTTDLAFENSDNVTHLLVENFTGAVGDDLDVDDDGVFDASIGTIVDDIALVETIGTGDLIYSTNILGPSGAFVPAHAFRDGVTGEFQIGAFDPVGGDDTPGSANATAIPEPSSAVAVIVCLGLAGIRRKRS